MTFKIKLGRALALLFTLLLASTALALPSTATDGKSYGTTFTVTLSLATASDSLTSAKVDQSVKVTGTLTPDPAHANKMADIFVVERFDNQFYMRNLSGQFVPWNGTIPALQPAKEGVNLGSGISIEVYTGKYSNPGKHSVFLGYMPTGGKVLIYTPVPGQFEIKGEEISISPLTFFGDMIDGPLIQTRCIACHVSGGVAKDSAMILERSSATSLQHNFDTLKNLQKTKGTDYILAKASMAIPHTGGVQLNPGGTEYNNMATMLGLLSGSTTAATVPASDFFNGVVLQTRPETLRRAAIMLAGRAPTQAEIDAVSKGDELVLRGTLRNLMVGKGFHEFITEGTNDRLLTEGVQGQVIDPAWGQWQKFMQELYDIRKMGKSAGLTPTQYKMNSWNVTAEVDYGMTRSIGELVAYVAENEKPYTEILTADYMMMTPAINRVLEGGATFKNPADRYEFAPGRITNYFLPDGNMKLGNDIDLGFYAITPSQTRRPWQHIGILNHLAFLQRYPTTATNRNRARARWTLLNFMDIDIEKSTQRPTDPAALADKNNPTMNNPNCSACHERMDPVAAAFQLYGEEGFYKFNGTDSLDQFYKYPPPGSGSTPYVPGDMWYRDMRSAGLLGTAITGSEPLQGLANLIIKDPAFARATVKFWWPSVMNADILLAPVVTTDADYQARLTAYQAQSAAVEQFARNFAKDFNLKNLLTDMMMSPWFRAESSPRADKLAAYEEADVGVEKLLTPERLQRKTAALTGFHWGYTVSPQSPPLTDLEGKYNGLYGGIDSFGVTRRNRDMTPLMSAVAQSSALESACPIVLKEFLLPDINRLLFGGMDGETTPLTQAATKGELVSKDQNDWQTISLTLDLQPGIQDIKVGMLNPYCDYDAVNKKCLSQRILYLDRFEIKAPGQTTFQLFEITADLAKDYKPQCYRSGATNALTFAPCMPNMLYDVKVAGRYEIRAVIAGQQAGAGNIQYLFTVEDTKPALTSTSNAALRIRQKLVELHSKLLGKTYALDSAEINDAYTLFVQAWTEKTQAGGSGNLTYPQTCNFWSDQSFFEGLNSGIQLKQMSNGWYSWDPAEVNAYMSSRNADTLYVKQSWVVVMAYLLSHYDYLYE